jgi:hypothetical protein
MKAFTAKFSDLGQSRTNPAGLWSPHYVALKQTLERGDTPDNVLQALNDWLNTKGITPAQLDKILNLSDLNAAYEALVGLVGAKLSTEHLPPAVASTLKAAIQRLAQNYVAQGEKSLEAERARLMGIKSKFAEGAPAEVVVDKLLD